MKKIIITSIAAAVFSATLSLTTPAVHAQIPFSLFSDDVPSLAPMLDQVTPGVVRISVAGSREVRRRVPEIFRFFGQGNVPEYQEERPFEGLGSGVVINAEDGYIVTNNHVIDQADEILVTLKDGREFEAKLIGRDEDSDIALLQIDTDKLTEIKLANSDKLRVGDFAIAIGNPFGLTQTVTSGIISALGRSGLNIEGYEDFIQTDAAINSGNSGGALVNLNGELIGINTAIYGPNGGNVGIGFAIPSNMMSNLVEQILEYGEVRRGILGVRGGPVTAELAEALGLDTAQGAFINEVLPDSAAEEADIQSGDVITSVNGVKIKTFAELAGKIGTIGAGKTVKLGLIRDGKSFTAKVKLNEASASTVSAASIHEILTGSTLSNGETEQGNGGVIVDSIEARSIASRVGLKEEDVILAVNKQRVRNLSELRTVMDDLEGVIALQVQRGNARLYLVAR